MEFNYETPKHFHLNLEAIAKNKSSSGLVRLLAVDLLTIGYVNVGSFIESMTDDELRTLLDGIDNENDDKNYEEMLLISEMLAIGEGGEPSKDEHGFAKRVNQLTLLLTVESLARHGMVKVFRNNFSLHDDAGDNIIVEKLDE